MSKMAYDTSNKKNITMNIDEEEGVEYYKI